MKYSISAMCKTLGIPRSLVYYKKKCRVRNTLLENGIIKEFKDSRDNYGSRKLKVELGKKNIIASRRKIREFMKKYNLVSNYTVKQYKLHRNSCNDDNVAHEIKRAFNGRDDLEVIVSDLIYVSVSGKWHYICLLPNLFNREILGYSAGSKKDASLVYDAFMSSNANLSKIKIFHTDRGNEVKNKTIDEVLIGFGIKRSLSKKGCPYDNAITEAGYKIIKTEYSRTWKN